jgi:hypothetical protein
MAAPDESAVSLRWLLDDVGAPLTVAWCDIRDQMREPVDQRILFEVDWISDPCIAKGIQAAEPLPNAIPIWNPLDPVDAWPNFGVEASLAAASVPIRRTREDALETLLSTAPSIAKESTNAALEDFMASERQIKSHGDRHMIFGDQVRAWILAAVGSLLRGLAVTSSEELDNAPTHGDIRPGFVYERVPHITLKSIANNAEIDVIWDKYQAKLEPLCE